MPSTKVNVQSAAKSTLRLGKVQLEIMRVLWRDGNATARRITEVLNESEPIAHSTVQTLLRKLEAKGAVAHEVEDRIFVFRPLYHETEVTETATRDLLKRLFGGSVTGLVAHLMAHEKISDDEMQELRRLIQTEVKK